MGKAKAKEEVKAPAKKWDSVKVRAKLNQLVRSPLQKRTQMGDMEALTASVREHGIITALKGRPADMYWDLARRPGVPTNWNVALEQYVAAGRPVELISGYRRKAAAIACGIADVDLELGLCDDATALDIQAADNLDQERYHPLDEAALYDAMLEARGTIEAVAKHTGRSVAHIASTLKLIQLAEKVKAEFLLGTIDVSVAKCIARIPLEALQLEAFADVRSMQPSQARSHIQRRFMLRLADAPFDTADANLMIQPCFQGTARACSNCDANTAVQRDLFADVSEDAALCTDRACWDAKAAVAWDRFAAKAKKAGSKVVDVKDSHKFMPGGDPVKAGFVPLDRPIEPGSTKTWRELLGDIPAADIIVIREPSGHATELYPLELAREQVKALKPEHRPRVPESGEAEKEREASDRRKERDKAQHRNAAMTAIVAAGQATFPAMRLEPLRWICRGQLGYSAHLSDIVKRRGLGTDCTPSEALLAEVERQPIQWLWGLLVELSLCRKFEGATDKVLEDICDAWGVSYRDLAKAKKGKAKTTEAPGKVVRHGGPMRCQSSCGECKSNPGGHHWGDPMIGNADDDPEHEAAQQGVEVWFQCKHCLAWVEYTDSEDGWPEGWLWPEPKKQAKKNGKSEFGSKNITSGPYAGAEGSYLRSRTRRGKEGRAHISRGSGRHHG